MRRFYPNYLWIIPGWYSENWWKDFPLDYLTSLNCTLTEVEQVLHRSLTLLPVPGLHNSTNGASIVTNSSRYAVDAVKTLAQALNKSLEACSSAQTVDYCRHCITGNLYMVLQSQTFNAVSSILKVMKKISNEIKRM